MKIYPTSEELKELFEYKDGSIFWKKSQKKNQIKVGQRAGASNHHGYRCVGINGSTFMEHKIIFLMLNGHNPEFLDHINRIKDDNRIENLRSATKSQNSANSGKRSDNNSGFKGISPNGKNWMALIVINGVKIYLGTFKTKELAHAKYCEYSKNHFKEFSHS